MAANSKFAIAIHTMGVLAYMGERHVSSELIATSVSTNPVVIRRIIRKFVTAGLVSVRMGTGGGATLRRPATEISLFDIHSAIEDDRLFQVPHLASDHECPVGRFVRPVLAKVFGGLEVELKSHLQGISLKDVMDEVASEISAEKCSATKNEE
ncbi:MAG: Rrf2 family transcriptional regulator [Pyrinomonadaceae bacterium]|nr:Rrf2 family transcriptional regulator [Pyrinomonadaceae bacterium]